MEKNRRGTEEVHGWRYGGNRGQGTEVEVTEGQSSPRLEPQS